MADDRTLCRTVPEGARIDRWRAPDGWDLRRFTWPAASDSAPRGSILFQGGRGDIFEKYLETLDHWHRRGWHVTSFDWRGQGGSGRLTDNPHCGHIDRFEQFIDDLAVFFRQWVAQTPAPHVIMGHSMGGHLVLRALAEQRIAPAAAVLIAPMLGLHGPIGPRFAEWLARRLGGVGNPARPAWKGNEKPYTTDTRAALLTDDADRYADEIWWQTEKPELLTGPPSWNWVIEAFASTRNLRDPAVLGGVRVPTLMLIADHDKLVDPRAAHAIAARLPDNRVVRFGRESAHEILREVDAVRNRALAEIDLFLDSRARSGADSVAVVA